ncbi:MAG: T9SS type A sorting domain-containing protein, partial [Chlorobi bacterium]|nr:T9SS type A sorting domain-containing protein [Chlorobiota bacterium]
LTVSNAISFESEVPSIFTFGGDADWTRVQDEAYDGDYSMKSGSITDDQTSVMQAELNITSAGDISFYKKVSSESGYDYLKFYIDGTEKGSWSGEVDWSQESYSVTTGTHTFKWEYSKDGSVSNGSDCAWVDYVEFPEYEEPETYTVTFNVTDGTDPLENALVSFNSQNKYTNASGEAVFTDVNQANNMSWSVSKTGYNSQSGTLDITDSDVTKNVILSELETYTVTFNITDGTNPLENALVTFNSQNKYSDADGIAVFNDIEPDNGLPWTVAKTGYTTQNGTVDVTDQDVSINVSINSTDIDIILTISNINISPNPASDFVNISFYTENKTETEIYIYSYNGKLVKTFNLGTLNEGNHKISWNTKNGNNGKKVSSGIYFIKIISGNSYKTAKLILTN